MSRAGFLRVACAVLSLVLAAVLWVPAGVGAQSADGEAVGSASWSSVLSVGVDGSAAPVVSGFSLWSGLGSLSGGPRFELGGTKGRVLALMDYGDGLLLSLSAMPGSDFSLVVDGVEFEASRGLVPSLPGRARFWWPLDRVLWSEGDEVDVELRVVAGGSALGPRAAAPPWAWLRGFPGSHEGAGALWVDLLVSEPVAAGAGEVRGSVRVIGGALDRVQRRDSALGDRWGLEVVPDGDGDVTVWLDTSQGCAALGWWCTSDGRDVHNSPQFTVAGPASATRLASLGLDGFDLDSAFDPDRALHTAWVPDGVETVTVHAAAAHPDATVGVSPADADPDADGHQVAVAAGAQTVIAVTVTAGTNTDTYWLVVDHGGDPADAPGTRSAQPARSGLSGLAVDGVDPISFDPQTHRYELPAPPEADSARTHTVVTGLDDTDATVEVLVVHGNDTALGWDPTDADPDTPGHQITLADRGDTLILIRVTSSNGRHQQIYALLIQTPQTQSPTQTPPPAQRQSQRSQSPTQTLTHKLSATDVLNGRPSAQQPQPHAQLLRPAAAPPAVAKTLNGTRDSALPQLASLSLGEIALTPPFTSDATDYTADVAHDVERVTVDATAASGNSATITPADADPNTSGHQVDLAAPEPGGTPTTTAIAVAVRTTDNQLNTYTITVTRQASPFAPDRNIDTLKSAGNDAPEGIWSDGTTMWVSDRLDGKVYAYVLATGARDPGKDINRLRTSNPGNAAPKGIWSDGTTMWVVDFTDIKVYAYNLDNGARRSHKDINGLQAAGNGSPMGIWSDGTTMWVGDFWDKKAYAYVLATGARDPGKDIKSPLGTAAGYTYGVWSDSTLIWVSDSLTDVIYAYDVTTGAREERFEIDALREAGNALPGGIWSDGTIMWVVDRSDAEIHAYNLPQHSLLASLELSGIDVAFAPSRRDYAVGAPDTVMTTTVSAVAADSDASIEITPADADTLTGEHEVDLSTGDNTVTVTVTNGDSTTTYTVAVTVAADDYAADVSTSGTVEVDGTPATGEIQFPTDRDWFEVELDAPALYRVDLQGADSSAGTLADPRLAGVFEDDGTAIAGTSDNNGGTGNDSRLWVWPQNAGTHYISAAASGSGTGTYSVAVSEIDMSDDIAADVSTAGAVDVDGAAATGEILHPDDQDWFSFDAEADTVYVIRLQGADSSAGTLADPRLASVFEDDGTAIAGTSDDNGGTGNDSALWFAAPAAGTYYVAAGSAEGAVGTYALTVETQQDDYSANASTSGTVTTDGEASLGEIEYSGDEDWFAVTLVAGSVYEIHLQGASTDSGSLSDPYMSGLYDTTGTFVRGSEGDHGGEGTDSRFWFIPIASGTHHVGARSSDSSVGTYSLSVTEREDLKVSPRNGIGFAVKLERDMVPSGYYRSRHVVQVPHDVSFLSVRASTLVYQFYGIRRWPVRGFEFRDADTVKRGLQTILYEGQPGGKPVVTELYVSLQPPGISHVEFSTHHWDEATDHVIVVTRAAPPEVEYSLPGTCRFATEVAEGGSAMGAVLHEESSNDSLRYADPSDCFVTELEGGKMYRFKARNVTMEWNNGVGVMGIYSSDGTRLANPNGDGTVWFEAPETGTYVIEAGKEHYCCPYFNNRPFFPKGTFRLTMDGFDDDFSADVSTSGVVVADGAGALGKIDYPRDADWFALEVTSGESYIVDVRSSHSGVGTLRDPRIVGFYDESGQRLAIGGDNDGGTGSEARTSFVATYTGTMYIAVNAVRDYTGTYEVSAAEVSAATTAD